MIHNPRALLKKGSDAKWMDVHSLDFKKIIDICVEKTVLKYYKPELELFLETDASGKGIGMALLQVIAMKKKAYIPSLMAAKLLPQQKCDMRTLRENIRGGWCTRKIPLFYILMPCNSTYRPQTIDSHS